MALTNPKGAEGAVPAQLLVLGGLCQEVEALADLIGLCPDRPGLLDGSRAGGRDGVGGVDGDHRPIIGPRAEGRGWPTFVACAPRQGFRM
ncbi:hypothetical protein GCM10010191_45330 [Actinomadura vinacea]|uniref:Uncharacterized protein n=1 Tax=Actinomadura vinacea TaxID=115336 RepID=A0ABN3JET9_9ACTN